MEEEGSKGGCIYDVWCSLSILSDKLSEMNLRFYTKPFRINLEPSEINRALQFAQQVTQTTNYHDSNQSNRAKIENDHFISKIGEEAVKIIFQEVGFNVKGPDYEIYRGNNKSWDEDLYINELGLAVKTQNRTSAEHFTASWTFQSAPTRRDPILDNPNAWVCFVLCEDDGSTCYIYPPYQIHELTFKDPKLSKLISKKQVIYRADLP